jgi:hypothetical protein
MKGAIVVVAANIDPALLWQAGVTHVAVELTDNNLRDFALPRWQGFVRGGFHVARDTSEESIRATARETAALVAAHKLSFLIEDTEAHKADLPDGVLKPERRLWTEWLYAELRSQLGPSFPLYNITSGIDSSPAVVNHEALRRYGVAPIWESYDANGATLGVARTAAKVTDEGWPTKAGRTRRSRSATRASRLTFPPPSSARWRRCGCGRQTTDHHLRPRRLPRAARRAVARRLPRQEASRAIPRSRPALGFRSGRRSTPTRARTRRRAKSR